MASDTIHCINSLSALPLVNDADVSNAHETLSNPRLSESSFSSPNTFPHASSNNTEVLFNELDLSFLEELCAPDVPMEYVTFYPPTLCSQYPELAAFIHLILCTSTFSLNVIQTDRLKDLHQKIQSYHNDEQEMPRSLLQHLAIYLGQLLKLYKNTGKTTETFDMKRCSWWNSPLSELLHRVIQSHGELKNKFDLSFRVEVSCDLCLPVQLIRNPSSEIPDGVRRWLSVQKPFSPHTFTLESRHFAFYSLCHRCAIFDSICRIKWEKTPEALFISFPCGLRMSGSLDVHICLPTAQLYSTILMCECTVREEYHAWMWVRHITKGDHWTRIPLLPLPEPPPDRITVIYNYSSSHLQEIQNDFSHVRVVFLEKRPDLDLPRDFNRNIPIFQESTVPSVLDELFQSSQISSESIPCFSVFTGSSNSPLDNYKMGKANEKFTSSSTTLSYPSSDSKYSLPETMRTADLFLRALQSPVVPLSVNMLEPAQANLCQPIEACPNSSAPLVPADLCLLTGDSHRDYVIHRFINNEFSPDLKETTARKTRSSTKRERNSISKLERLIAKHKAALHLS